MVNASRSYGREVFHMIDALPESDRLRRNLVRRQIAYVHALRCHLRRQPNLEEIRPFLSELELETLNGVSNVPNVILNGSAALIAEAGRKGWADSVRSVQIGNRLVDMSNAQGGMERIKNTPLPREYGYYPTLFVHIFSTIVGFMLLAMDRIGADLQDPFENRAHDVPLTSLCRTIQIDLEQLLGSGSATVPTRPVENVLW
jgi:putative membrane protein